MRAQLRALDLLAIDDVEGVAGWPVAVEELIHVIQSIHGAGGRLVFATRHPPSRWDAEPRALVHRLVSLLMGGVLVTLETPGAALRRRFVLEQIQGRGIALAAEAVDWLVAAADGFRTLEGWVTRLSFWARAQAPSSALRRMSLEQVGALLQDDAALVRPACAEMQTIAQAVAARFRVSVKALLGASRRRDVVEPRHLAILLAKAHTANSQAAIGRFFGARDPKTVRHACQAAQTRIERDPRWAAAAHDLARALAGQDAAAISHTLRPGDEWY